MVHQHFQLIPVFTVAENVVLGNELRKGPAARPRRRPHTASATSAQRYGLDDRPRRGGRRPVGRRAAARRADQGALPRRRHPDPRRADGGAHPGRGRRASSRSSGAWSTRASRSSSSPTSCARCWRSPTASRCCGAAAWSARPTRRRPPSRAWPRSWSGATSSFTIDKAPRHTRRASCCGSRASTSTTTAASTTVDGFDLEVRAGEIFGIAGVEGNGQRELVEALMGMRAKRAAARSRSSATTSPTPAPRRISELGVGHVPEDRGKHGLVGPVHAWPTTSCSTATAAPPSAAAASGTTGAIDRQARRAGASTSTCAPPAPRCPSPPCRAATSRR